MPTLSPLMPRTHLLSHCFSWGQTRPQTAGRELVEVMISYAASKSPSATLAMNSGMRTETGQPVRQGILWQLRQRFASSIAISGV